MRLWESDHPYYCSESNYYVNGLADPPWDHVEVESWEAFDWKDSDPDMNLLFRWDWKVPDPDDYGEDDDVPGEQLLLFWMLQRKGRFMAMSMPVSRDEEPEIRAWLEERAKTLIALWQPISLAAPLGDRLSR